MKFRPGYKTVLMSLFLILIIIFFILHLSLKRELNEEVIRFNELKGLYNEYSVLKPQYDYLKAHPFVFQGSLSGYMEKLVSERASKDNLKKIRPLKPEEGHEFRIEGLEVELDGISLSSALEILDAVDKTDGLFIASLSLKRDFEKTNLLDLNLVVQALKTDRGG